MIILIGSLMPNRRWRRDEIRLLCIDLAADPAGPSGDPRRSPGAGPGTARVQRTTLHGDETLVTLGYPRGQQVEVRVPVVPAGPHEIAGLRRPLAVHVDNRREQVECSVLGTSWSGPRRLRISLGHALALAHSGVHTVVVTS